MEVILQNVSSHLRHENCYKVHDIIVLPQITFIML